MMKKKKGYAKGGLMNKKGMAKGGLMKKKKKKPSKKMPMALLKKFKGKKKKK
tara:strand:+ start:329 stop:484 length:156 start_codon:yes stop_codon:yes gene_type:complete